MRGRRKESSDSADLRSVFLGPAYQAAAESRYGPGLYDFTHFTSVGNSDDVSPTFYFDPEFYASQVGAATGPLLSHFLEHGAEAGLCPHPLVQPRYVADQLEIRPAEALGALTSGSARLARPHPLFWTDYYLDSNPDIAGKVAHPLHHYLTSGHRREREPNPFFTTAWFREIADQHDRDIAPLLAFVNGVMLSDLSPSPLFDPIYYRQRWVEAGGAPIEDASSYWHFMTTGLMQDIEPHPMFDTGWYRSRYEAQLPDNMPAVLHYLRKEHERNHQPGPRFDPAGVARISVVEAKRHDFGGRILERYLSGGATAVFAHVALELPTAFHEQIAAIGSIVPDLSQDLSTRLEQRTMVPQNYNAHVTRKTRALKLCGQAPPAGSVLLLADSLGPSNDEFLLASIAGRICEEHETRALIFGRDESNASVSTVRLGEIGEDLGLAFPDLAQVATEFAFAAEPSLVVVGNGPLSRRFFAEYGAPLAALTATCVVSPDGHDRDVRQIGSFLSRIDAVVTDSVRQAHALQRDMALDESTPPNVVVVETVPTAPVSLLHKPDGPVVWVSAVDLAHRAFEAANYLESIAYLYPDIGNVPLTHAAVRVLGSPVGKPVLEASAFVADTGTPLPWIASALEVGVPVIAVDQLIDPLLDLPVHMVESLATTEAACEAIRSCQLAEVGRSGAVPQQSHPPSLVDPLSLLRMVANTENRLPGLKRFSAGSTSV